MPDPLLLLGYACLALLVSLWAALLECRFLRRERDDARAEARRLLEALGDAPGHTLSRWRGDPGEWGAA